MQPPGDAQHNVLSVFSSVQLSVMPWNCAFCRGLLFLFRLSSTHLSILAEAEAAATIAPLLRSSARSPCLHHCLAPMVFLFLMTEHINMSISGHMVLVSRSQVQRPWSPKSGRGEGNSPVPLWTSSKLHRVHVQIQKTPTDYGIKAQSVSGKKRNIDFPSPFGSQESPLALSFCQEFVPGVVLLLHVSVTHTSSFQLQNESKTTLLSAPLLLKSKTTAIFPDDVSSCETTL